MFSVAKSKFFLKKKKTLHDRVPCSGDEGRKLCRKIHLPSYQLRGPEQSENSIGVGFLLNNAYNRLVVTSRDLVLKVSPLVPGM